MKHVALKSSLCGYPPKTVFAVVPHRGYTTMDYLLDKVLFVTDGFWIGDFPAYAEKSRFTNLCVTQEGLSRFIHFFDSADQDALKEQP